MHPSEALTKRARNNVAQREFRERERLAEAHRKQTVKRLGGIIEELSTKTVRFVDHIQQVGVLGQHPALAADLHHVMTQVLKLCEAACDLQETSSNESYQKESSDYQYNSDARRYSQVSASPSGSQAIPTKVPYLQQGISSLPEYSQVIGTPQVYPIQDPAYSDDPYRLQQPHQLSARHYGIHQNHSQPPTFGYGLIVFQRRSPPPSPF
ncbi:hypothetical protein FOPG_16260 [Fusarium oxysporum f. sp. conglutinans race 2 54008]|uniref:Uncharacterized protein n=1 Tax=Fusarium oxysporum f. sp. conglutinans race 2 54008 TaxID=1089457 RepID=X0I2V9_FUSOX|nr:hypothetical protein FOPG_16260 [Fusarium oxysporum f. sp. conglutinans race 2 54008]KAG7000155.1 hypothetical protein FocnCong_v012563 [Fusarium oxysporum f. sp. conglutinans]